MKRTVTPTLAITIGDFNGVGPEVTLKSIGHPAVRRVCRVVLVGPAEAFGVYAAKLRIPLHLTPFDGTTPSPPSYSLLESSSHSTRHIVPGKLSRRAGEAAVAAIASAVKAARAGIVDGIVTAPVSKQALHLAGARFPGQTEMVQRLSGSSRVAMMLVSDTMRVGLATIHIPLCEVARTVTREHLRERIDIIYSALQRDWRIRRPKIAVLGLNPHASEGGDIGNEDPTIVSPVIKECRKKGMNIEGPFPADAFFGLYKQGMYDGIVAMYHDQGLIPLKMSSFGKAVNISAGLDIVRTSPDHGTAFDIAGKGIANPGSMIAAITLAALVVRNRRKAKPT